jgi:CubicO group peptidase (beta-lactamase class C family)
MKKILIYLIGFSAMAQNIETKLQNIVNENKLMGLSVYTFSGKTEKTYNLGFRNEALKLPITNETRFRIASISKAFTSLGIMKLYDKKLFKLDDDISKYLGFKIENPNFPNVAITFRMLLSHTSSIQDGAGYDTFLSATYNQSPIPNVSTLITPNGASYTTDMFMNHKPGSFYTYCNFNFGLLGTLIEKISKQRFDIYMKNEILKPLGITSSFNIQDLTDIENMAVLYRAENNVWTPQKDDYNGIMPKSFDFSTYQIGNNAVYFAPQGGFRTSVADLARFIKYLKSNGQTVPNLISKSTLKKMKKAQWSFENENGDNYNGFFNRYALGLHHTNTYPKDAIGDSTVFGDFIGHAGDAYGLISDAYFSEKENFGFVIVTNGCFGPFIPGKTTSFYNFEEQVFKVICDEYLLNKKSKKE